MKGIADYFYSVINSYFVVEVYSVIGQQINCLCYCQISRHSHYRLSWIGRMCIARLARVFCAHHCNFHISAVDPAINITNHIKRIV